MQTVLWKCGAVILTFVAPAAVIAQDGRIAQGLELAKQWCASCHVIGPTQAPGVRAADNAPTFAQVANRATTNEAYLRNFIQAPHGRMPNLAITRREADDLIAYVLSLRGK